MKRSPQALLAIGLMLAVVAEARALITGGEGNKPLRDPGWPKGAAAIFNHPGRVAWWEGPPFGGGNWHAECRGDAKTLSPVLADLAKVDAKVKRVVVHDGVGHSFWLAPNREPAKLANAKIDWSFSVWQQSSWDRLRRMPADLNPTSPGESSPPAQIDVYAGGVRWSDVAVPPGVEVIDKRLEAHGYAAADGIVIEGKVTDASTSQPLPATIKLERIESGKQGGYDYPRVAETKADAQGHWVLKKVPAGWFRVVAEAPGFAPRVVSYAKYDEQPRWELIDTTLAKAVAVAGRVTDDAGQPLADVEVSLGNVAPQSGERYTSPSDYKSKSGADGRFRIEQVPEGKAAVWVHKQGYVRPGLGESVSTPADNVELKMYKSASIEVTINFTGKTRPEGYIVSMSPEGGDKIGSYGGSGQINAENKMSFRDVPAGRYVVRGRPNPGSDREETGPMTVELKGGETTTVTLKAK